jgi:hypothetical protein
VHIHILEFVNIPIYPEIVLHMSRRLVTLPRRYFTSSSSSGSNQRVLETWEEVERNRPRVPTLDGYMRPARAPKQEDIPREEFHRFMMGKAPKIPEQWRAFVGGFILFSWCIGACAFTMYKLRPDDFEWLEEERNKAEAAKARLAKKLAQQAESQQ